MNFASELEAYSKQAEAAACKNVSACLAEWKIVRDDFEALINRLSQSAGPIYYVSTVPRGQAGTTSDLDVIVVGRGAEAPSLSNMLFHQGRRVGAKVIAASTVWDAIDIVRAAVSVPELGRLAAVRQAARQLPLKWHDLERVVNGVSFSEGCGFIAGLPALCEWQLCLSLGDYSRHRTSFRLAVASGATGSANAYLSLALMAAMDAVMARCGRVQSNNKWTFVRWGDLVADCAGRGGDEVLGPLTRALADLHATSAPPCNALEAIDRLVGDLFGPRWIAPQRLGLRSGVQLGSFLPGAVFVTSPERTAILSGTSPSSLLSALEMGEADGSVAAGDILSLLQQGLIDYELGAGS